MKKYITSDLIEETYDSPTEASCVKKAPQISEERTEGNVKIKRSVVRESDCADIPVGRHSTLFTQKLHLLSESEENEISRIVTAELRFVLGEALSGGGTLLVAGLGNRKISSDALGVLTAEGVCVTRHMQLEGDRYCRHRGIRSVCTVMCGVLGNTGMRSLEVLRGAVREVNPDAVIAVDALAARSAERLGATVQLSDAGIAPGAGIGNRQAAINKHTLGVPVVAIGVPTLISAPTLVGDILAEAGVDFSSDSEKILERGRGFFVCPKECDLVCESAAKILARGIDGLLEY